MSKISQKNSQHSPWKHSTGFGEVHSGNDYGTCVEGEGEGAMEDGIGDNEEDKFKIACVKRGESERDWRNES